MFTGEYRHNLDAKGRIIIPSKLREELGFKFVITKGLDGCLAIYNMEQWGKMLEKLNLIPETSRDGRLYKRMFTSKACECQLDNQGRIIIPTNLLKEANITKESVVVGAGEWVEIWSEERWEAICDEASSKFEDIAEKLTSYLI